MELIDAHAHIGAEEFASDLEAVLERARAAGVTRIVAVAEDLEDCRRNLELSARYPLIRPCAGLHPEFPDTGQAEAVYEFVRAHAERLVGIGEVGLDRWKIREGEALERQRAIFAGFIRLSLEFDLPLNVHSRSAGRETVAFLAEHSAKRVLLHAFDGRAGAALQGLEHGYYFSVPPSIVRSRQKEKLLRHLPLDRILLETDSPVLGPDPRERNEPANVRLVVEEIAKRKGVPEEEVARRTTENALRLFPKLAS